VLERGSGERQWLKPRKRKRHSQHFNLQSSRTPHREVLNDRFSWAQHLHTGSSSSLGSGQGQLPSLGLEEAAGEGAQRAEGKRGLGGARFPSPLALGLVHGSAAHLQTTSRDCQ
jgi:hypothetical protein